MTASRTVRWLTEEQVGKRAAQAASGKQRERVRAEVMPFLMPVPDGEDSVDTEVQGSKAVLRLYDVIDSWGGWWGISASEVASALEELPDTVALVEVHLNSPGGEATEGVAVANILRQHAARCVGIVDGLAASAASMVAMGCDELVMAPGSQLMIHAASGGAWGLAEDLRRYAQSLDSISGAYAQAYAEKAGGTVEEWLAVMAEETWFAPAEAVASGLADRLLSEPATNDPAAAVARHDLRVFAHAGRASAPAPRLPGVRPARGANQAAKSGTTAKEARVSDTLLTNLRQSLGLAEDADEATVMAEHQKAMAALQELNDSKPPAPTLPPGVVTVDAERLARLEADAQAGAKARAQQETDRRAALVSAAVADGRIPPARRDAWVELLAADPGAEQALAGLAKGTVPLAEVGHGQEADTSEDDALYASLFATTKEA